MNLQSGVQYQLGTTKVFVRKPVNLFALEELRERKLHDLATLIQTIYRAWKARKYFLELRQKALGIYQGRKQRRRASVRRYYVGDYLNAALSMPIQKILSAHRESRVMFLDEVDKMNRKWKVQRRALLLTDGAVYNLGTGKFKLNRRISIMSVASVSVSPLSDNFFVINVPSEYDYVFISERKTEIIAALCDVYRTCTGQELPVHIKSTVPIQLKDKNDFLYLQFTENPNSRLSCVFVQDARNKKQMNVSVGAVELASEAMIDNLQQQQQQRAGRASQAQAQPATRLRGYSALNPANNVDDEKKSVSITPVSAFARNTNPPASNRAFVQLRPVESSSSSSSSSPSSAPASPNPNSPLPSSPSVSPPGSPKRSVSPTQVGGAGAVQPRPVPIPAVAYPEALFDSDSDGEEVPPPPKTKLASVLNEEDQEKEKSEEAPDSDTMRIIPSDSQTCVRYEDEGVAAEASAYLESPLAFVAEIDLMSQRRRKQDKLYRMIKILGSGAYGKTYLAENTETGTHCVVKKIPCRHLDEVNDAIGEILTLSMLSCLGVENVVRFFDFFLEAPSQPVQHQFEPDDQLEVVGGAQRTPINLRVCIVMEYCSGGDLEQVLQRVRQKARLENLDYGLDQELLLSYVYHITLGLVAIHEARLIHRDLKPANLLLSDERQQLVKLADFGVARQLRRQQDQAATTIGTPAYMAPEIMAKKEYDAKVDIWSLGCLVYEMMCLHPPVMQMSSLEDVMAEINDSYYNQAVVTLVQSMLQKDPRKRPDARAILSQVDAIIKQNASSSFVASRVSYWTKSVLRI
eukprot:TRINITY_DN1837_c0_g1_i15.p1 TRINITY_DN1837_c0_g1~~TRINITY_DN1837_c0_g1_i15.p1  ORF type:complete len:865 (+),score=234.52 TRINITY_DN1837_c0_g1_i15:192-2597(+)